MNESHPLLEVKNLKVEFELNKGKVTVVNQVNFSLNTGETLAIVGESGCGKSLTALSLLRLIPSPPGSISGGEILFKGQNILNFSEKRLRQYRGGEVSMIFQEPMTSLNPVYTIGDQIMETIRLHENINSNEAKEKSIDILNSVGIPEPAVRIKNYPHQLSGGMRQRVMIAMALVCNPAILIADEPTTALDVTVQAQVFDLIGSIKETFSTSMILITHDIGVVAHMADRIAIMYAGKIVETGSVKDILTAPKHPYTKGLIACIPHLEECPPPAKQLLQEIPGTVPPLSELNKPGCAFFPRCSRAMERCRIETPEPVGNNHQTACLLYE